jgi:hypothetical protein
MTGMPDHPSPASDDVPSPHDAVFAQAAELAVGGDVGAARVLLDELAERLAPLDEPLDRARALRLAATLARLDGDPVGARHRAVTARGLAEAAGDPRLALDALVELAEDRLANREFLAAAADFEQAAVDVADRPMVDAVTGRIPFPDSGSGDAVLEARSGLRIKQAEALAGAGRFTPAADVLEVAAGRAETAGDGWLAAGLLVQAVTVAQQGGRRPHVDRLDGRARSAAEAVTHHGALGELDVLAAARALDDGDAPRALALTGSARSHALDAVQPLTYVAAVLTAAQVRDVTGDRAGAYRELSRGWATVGDLLGAEVARATFEPALLDLKQRWGDEAFAAVKTAYETGRRADLADADDG